MVELYIQDRLADLDGVPSMAFTKRFETLTDPATINTAASKMVRLPATETNNDIFSRIGRMDALNHSFDPRVKTPFVLAIDGADMMLGYIQLTSIEWYMYEPRWYNITLFEATNDILKYMSEKDCADIIMPHNNLSHTINKEAVANQPFPELFYFPSYQGQYEAFEAGKYETVGTGEVVDYDRDYDENEIQEYRSYYQKVAVKFSTIFTAMMDAMPFATNCSDGVLNSPYYANTVLCLPAPFKEGETTPFNGRIEQTPPADDEYPDYTGILTFPSEQPGIWNAATMKWSGESDPRFSPGTGVIDLSGLRPTDVISVNLKAVILASVEGSESRPQREYTFDAYNGQINPHELEIMFSLRSLGGEPIAGQDIFYKIDARNLKTRPKAYRSYLSGCYWTNNNGETIGEVNIELTTTVRDFEQAVAQIRARYQNYSRWAWSYRDANLNKQYAEGTLVVAITYDSTFKVVASESTRSNSPVNWSSLMPRGKTNLQLFTSFVKSFGLLTEYDPIAKRLDIKTRNEFFAGYKILDWTNKIDYSQPVQIKPLVFDYRYGSMEHTPSKSYRNEAYNKTNGQNYGEQLIDTEFEFNNEEHSLLGTSVFTSMIMSSEYGRMFNGRTNEAGRDDKVLPLIAAKDGAEWKSIDESLQLAFDNGMVSCKPYRITDDTPKMVGENSYMWYSTGDNPTGSIVMSSYRQLSRIKAGYSLDFSKPKEIYYNGPEYPDNAGIYARMWQRYMQERLSVNTRVMTANVYLTPAEFFGWKFNQFVVIGDVLWHVNKIENFDPLTTQTTRVELVRVVDLAAYGSQDLTPPEAGTDKYPITIRVNTFEADGEIPLGGTLVSVSIGSEIAEDKTMWTNSSGEASFTYSLSEAEYRRIQQITAKGSLYLYNDSLSTLDSLPTFESAVSNGINLSVHMAKANLLFTMDPVVVAFTATGGTKDITVVCPVENWEIYMPTSISGVTVTKINSTTIRVVAAASSLDAEIRGEIYARYYSDALGEWQYRSTSFVQSEGTVQGSIRFYGTVQDSVTGMNLTNSNNFAVQVSAWNGSSRQVIANSALVNGSWSVSTTSTQGTWPSYVQLSVAIIVDGYTSSVKYMTPPAWASAVADGVNFGNMLMDQES